MSSIEIGIVEKVCYLQDNLISWYSENGRRFFWRNKSLTKYQIVIAEIFLQRTKADTVAKFLPIFLRKYPSWKQLGNASEFEVQDILKPIGLYKQRGTRLFLLAQEMKNRRSRFPKTRVEIEKMPSMGQYIANAFELSAYNKRVPLLDVNMARLLERYFGIKRLADIRFDKNLQSFAYRVVDFITPKIINWAILDFSAIICKSSKQLCNHCVLRQKCHYYEQKLPT